MYYQLAFFYDEHELSQIRGVEFSRRQENGSFSVISVVGNDQLQWTRSMKFHESDLHLAEEILRFIAKHLGDKPVTVNLS